MEVVPTREPPEGEAHLTFETAAEHATVRVPVAGPLQRVGDVRALLVGQRYESASHIIVCEAHTFLGVVAMENLLWLSWTGTATSWESFRRTGWSQCCCRSMKKTSLALVAF